MLCPCSRTLRASCGHLPTSWRPRFNLCGRSFLFLSVKIISKATKHQPPNSRLFDSLRHGVYLCKIKAQIEWQTRGGRQKTRWLNKQRSTRHGIVNNAVSRWDGRSRKNMYRVKNVSLSVQFTEIKKVVRGSHAQRLECILEVLLCRGTVDLKLPFVVGKLHDAGK
jgi:hypothetical protein